MRKNRIYEARPERNIKGPVLWLITIFACGSEQAGWRAVSLTASWAAKQEILPRLQPSFFPQWSLVVLPLFLCTAAFCSPADLQLPELSYCLLFVLSFPLLFCLKNLKTFFSKEKLVIAQGRSAPQRLPLPLLLKWTLESNLEANHTYQQSPYVMVVVKNHQLFF